MDPPESTPISLREATRVWWEIGLNSFGGPAGQIAVMHRILVDERKWISERRFLHALNYCMLLPGPEAQQLATYAGWLLHGWRGGLIAGGLFVLPGFVSILALSLLYTAFAGTTWLLGLFVGLKAAVLALVLQAVLKIGKRVLHGPLMVAVALVAFVALFGYQVPFPIVVLAAGLVGLLGASVRPDLFAVIRGHEVDPTPDAAKPSLARTLRVVGVFLLLWLAPIAALALALGPEHVFVHEAVFFSKAATVTFGGAYAVLSYIAQQAVEHYAWLRPGEMLDGLGMAETTPGPLIQVVQFVGYMGAYRNPGALEPWVAGVLGSILTTWVTFVPCFLWIFAGAPYIEALQGRPRLSGALSVITAAVVGVVCNLALWFGFALLFAEVDTHALLGGRWQLPRLETIRAIPAVLAVGAAVALLRLQTKMIPTLLVCAALGLLATLVA